VGMGVSVGRGVSVGKGANALAVAKAACPVNATTSEMFWVGKAVGADSANCEQAAKSVMMDATIRILYFMVVGINIPQDLIELTISIILRDVFIYSP